MIKVNWPMLPTKTLNDDCEVCDWLEDLVNQDKTKMVFELREGSTEIYFFNEEDATAFRLRFGL